MVAAVDRRQTGSAVHTHGGRGQAAVRTSTSVWWCASFTALIAGR
jgi:hypothetical protein